MSYFLQHVTQPRQRTKEPTVVRNAILKGGATISLQNRVRFVERFSWVKPYTQSFAWAFTVSAVQALQQRLNGWGVKSMASGRSSFNQMHLQQFHKGEKLHAFIDLPRCMLGSCHLLPATLPYISSYREELFSTSPFAAFLHERRLDPAQGRCQKSTYLWVENLDRLAVENDPASEGWREQYP